MNTSNYYRGNENLKAPNSLEYIDQNTFKERAKELLKCRQNIVHFAENYFTIVGDKGKHVIELYPKQRDFLEFLLDHNRVCCLASRQVGKTTTYTIYLLWLCLFNKDQSILIAANKAETSREILSRIKLAYEHLPEWIKPGINVWNRGMVEFSNGSKISGCSTSSESGRSKSCNVLVLDEAAAVPSNIMFDFWTSVYPIVSSFKDSKVIMVSTPKGVGNLFYETYENARLGIDAKGWQSFRIDWWEVPGRDEEWKQEQLASLNYDPVAFAQEYGNEFAGSARTLIRVDNIKKFKEFIISKEWFEPDIIEIEGGFTYNQWFKPEKDKAYIIGADPSSGIGGDFSVILVFDISTVADIKLVASFADNRVSTLEFPYILAKLGTTYNQAYIAMESNNMGDGVFNILLNNYEYENVINYQTGKGQTGIGSHVQTKGAACRWTRDFMNFDHVRIKPYEKHLVGEMEWFETKKKKVHEVYEAIPGKHDDFVMSFIWAIFCLTPEIVDNYYDVTQFVRTKTGLEIPLFIRQFNSSFYDTGYQDIPKINPDEVYRKNIIGESTDVIDPESMPKTLGFSEEDLNKWDIQFTDSEKSWL